jgi:DNA polymerase-3 subunit alpha
MGSRFVHLHVHSHYSLLEALPKPKDILKHVQKHEMDAVAVTDNGAMYGAIEFYQKAKDAGVKPILGMDAYLAKQGRLQKRAKIDTKNNRLVLLAETNEGYKNLLRLASVGFLEGFYYKPRLDREALAGNVRGLIALSGGQAGEIEEAISFGDREKAKALVRAYVALFGEGNFFLELVDRPEIAEQEAVNAALIELGRELGVPFVATKNAYYLKPGDVEAWKVLNCIKGQQTLEAYERRQQYEFDASLVSGEYMEKRFADVPEAIENTRRIADRCNVGLELGKWNFADFKIPAGKTFLDVLTARAYGEIEEKGVPLTDEVRARLDYELAIIEQKGFCPYFLIVSDYIEWARRNGIVTTTRGSAAGSLVGFSIGISTVNPLAYKLPFERFLNPERPSAPDVDADFADNRRDEMLAYVTERYGADKVAQICTFGTMAARGSCRDVGRALGYEYGFVDKVAKTVPMGSQGFPMTLERALEESPDLKKLYDTNAEVRRMVDLARQIEGCARHVSIHAAGVVISPTALTDFTPLQIDTREGKTITQYEMKSVEAAGLVKMDFLGIRNLSILGDAVKLVKRTKGADIVLEKIPLDDARTFDLLAHGKTMGTFQLNGDGMTKYLMDLRPARIEDIMAMVALYRPGPIEMIPEYIRRKHNPALVKYMDPRMRDILDASYGVIVYQDDVMLIAIKLAGYSWLEADKLRKAMGKKIPEEMQKQKEKLLDGFVKNGMTPAKAQELWKLIEPFAAYGFNKCLAGDTRVMDPRDGSYPTMRELFERGEAGSVIALQHEQSLKEEPRARVFQNGVKSLFALRTRSGRRIRATANHPFLRFDGWIRLDALAVGDRIAVPRSLPAGLGTGLSAAKLRTLGYLVAEGNLCHPSGVYYYSASNDEVRDFIECAKAFENVRIAIDRSKSTAAVYVGRNDPASGNGLRDWLSSIGIMGKKATAKALPDIAYAMNADELSEMLAGMWQGDGCVHEGADGTGQIFYATSSEELARQTQHLLLRLGIFSTLHTKSFSYRGGRRTGYTINVSGFENVNRFFSTVGRRLLENKRGPLERIVARLRSVYRDTAGVIGRGTKDIVPAEAFALVRGEMSVAGLDVAECVRRTGLSERIFHRDKRRIGYTRPVLNRIACEIGSEALRKTANSDVYWDEIISIEPEGKEMTYDLEVPGNHNFVANDIIVHNSHAASYGMIAYDTAYMKANYPAEYMTSLMTAESADLETVAEAVKECRRMGIDVLAPDINESRLTFTYISDAAIRFGLVAIKNLGEEVIESIIAEREAKGPFADLSDFAARIHHRAFNKKSLEALIKSGALDRFGDRNRLLENTDRILLHNKDAQKRLESNQASLFSMAPHVAPAGIALRPAAPAPRREVLAWEKELLGLYVSAHPYEAVAAQLGDTVSTVAAAVKMKDGEFVRVGGSLTTVKQIVTKKGDDMAFVGLEDLSGKTELLVFPRTFAQLKDALVPDAIAVVSAKVSRRKKTKGAGGSGVEEPDEPKGPDEPEDGEDVSLIVNSLVLVEDAEAKGLAEMMRSGGWIDEGQRRKWQAARPAGREAAREESLSIALRGRPSSETVERLREALRANPGGRRVCLLVESGGGTRRIETEYSVHAGPEVVDEIAAIVGRQNVTIEPGQPAC